MSKPLFIYGPVYSWRMGLSLGIDPLATAQKTCNFDCTYCQLACFGEVGAEDCVRRTFVAVEDVVREIRALPPDVTADFMTFSGNGEPTLALNLGEMIAAVRALDKGKLAVITNGTLLGRKDVQADLSGADLVLVKLDAADEAMFQAINRPAKGITLASVLEGVRAFRAVFGGRLALQSMFVEKNKAQAYAMAALARTLGADEVQLNTPLRPCADRPLSPPEMAAIKAHFDGLVVRMIYDEPRQKYYPLDDQQTMRRHGKYNQV